MKKLLMLITAISLLPAYIFAAGDGLNDEKLDKAISQKVENAKKQKIEKEYMKAPAYIGMRKYIDKDDGDGLRKYIANYHKSGKHITEDDFYDIYEVRKVVETKYGLESRYLEKKIKQHKLCYAIAYNKVKAGKAIIDAGQYPKEGCRKYRYDGYTSKPGSVFLKRTEEEVSLWKNKTLADKAIDIGFTLSNDELSCYAFDKGLIPERWLGIESRTPALCKEEWDYKAIPLRKLVAEKEKLVAERERILAENEAKAKAKARAEKTKRELLEKGNIVMDFGVSDENWQNLVEQIGDDFSFAKQSIDVLSKLPTYNKLSLNKKKDSYNNAIKDLDNAYKKYVKSLAGGSVPENAKENYEYTKQVLKKAVELANTEIKEYEKQKKIAAEEKKKAAEQAIEEKRREKLEKLLWNDSDKVEMFLKILGKDLDDNKKQFMYFPNGANIECVFYGKNKDYYEYINPVFIVFYKEHYRKYVGERHLTARNRYGSVIRSNTTESIYEERDRHHITVYNMEGKKVKDEFVEYEYFMNVTVDVNDRLQPGKYKIHSEFKYKE